MNVVFDLPNDELTNQFVEEAMQVGLMFLKGHRKRGGIRASIYNAMPESGVDALISFMREFEQHHASSKTSKKKIKLEQ